MVTLMDVAFVLAAQRSVRNPAARKPEQMTYWREVGLLVGLSNTFYSDVRLLAPLENFAGFSKLDWRVPVRGNHAAFVGDAKRMQLLNSVIRWRPGFPSRLRDYWRQSRHRA